MSIPAINPNFFDFCDVYFLVIEETISLVFPATIMVTFCAVLLLLSNLLVFGIDQYNQKKVGNLQKCN